jgi:hypothetical protein
MTVKSAIRTKKSNLGDALFFYFIYFSYFSFSTIFNFFDFVIGSQHSHATQCFFTQPIPGAT